MDDQERTQTPVRVISHGNSGYTQGCSCQVCRDGRSRWQTRWRLDRERGAGPRIVDGAASREHIDTLRQAGMSTAQIARAAGLSPSTISNVGAGLIRLRRVTEQKILAVRVDVDTPATAKAGNARDATGTRRRIEALCTMGYSIVEQARRAGLHHDNLRQIVLGHTRRTTLASHLAIARLYEQLWDTPAEPSQSSRQTLAYARRRGFAPPMAWDDIDNDEHPQGVA